MQNNCAVCGAELMPDDVGASKKLINRGMTEGFMCVNCLADRFGVSEARIREKIEEWRESGCLLFGAETVK